MEWKQGMKKRRLETVSSEQELSRDIFESDLEIKDAIHGRLELPALAKRMIDTPQFQRLRKLKQVGACSLVFPCAVHTRFEHSIGVCHLAGKWVKNLIIRQPELNITKGDLLCVQIAGLCHDLGHGPYSHVFDGLIVPEFGGMDWHHEDGSIMMLDSLLKENEIDLSHYGLDPVRDLQVIKEMILGVPLEEVSNRDRMGTWPRKRFLYDIVNNCESGLDVDKLDYFERDVRITGLDGNSCKFEDLITKSRVMKCDDGLYRICFPLELYRTAFRAFQTRFHLHEEVYQHRTVKAVEYMIRDLVVGVLNLFLFRGVKLSQVVHDPRRYVALNDSIVDMIGAFIEDEMDKNHPKFQDLYELHNRLQSRTRLYHYIGRVPVPDDFCKTQDEIAKEICDACDLTPYNHRQTISELMSDGEEGEGGGQQEDEEEEYALKPEDMIVELQNLHFGKKGQNPMDSMYFFPSDEYSVSKFSMDGKAQRGDFKKMKYKYMAWLPPKFMHKSVRVFIRDLKLYPIVNKKFRLWAKKIHTIYDLQESPRHGNNNSNHSTMSMMDDSYMIVSQQSPPANFFQNNNRF